MIFLIYVLSYKMLINIRTWWQNYNLTKITVINDMLPWELDKLKR